MKSVRLYVRKNEIDGDYLNNFDCPIARMLKRKLQTDVAVKVFTDSVALVNLGSLPYMGAKNFYYDNTVGGAIYCRLFHGRAYQIQAAKTKQCGFHVTIRGIPESYFKNSLTVHS